MCFGFNLLNAQYRQAAQFTNTHTFLSICCYFFRIFNHSVKYTYCLLNNSAHCTIIIAEMCAIETEALARFTVLEIQLLAFAIIECNSCNLQSIIRPNMRHFLWCEMVTIFYGLSVQLALKRRILFRKVKTNVFWICVVPQEFCSMKWNYYKLKWFKVIQLVSHMSRPATQHGGILFI